MDIHHKVAAWLRLITSLLMMFVLIPLMVLGWLFLDELRSVQGVEHLDILLMVLFGLCAFVVLLNLAECVAAVCCLRGSLAARHWLMVFAILGLLNFPLGTALGAYTLWAMARPAPKADPLPPASAGSAPLLPPGA